MIEIINWPSFQSYKDRKPPWIRFHRTLLDNFEYQSMSADSRALLPMLWLLASEDMDPLSGCIRISYEKIAFRLRIPLETVTTSLQEIQRAGFILIKQLCIESVTEALQDRYETVTPETETETETENINTTNMSLFEIRKRFREMIGTELGGGVNQVVSEISKNYTPEAIEFALLATSTVLPKPRNPFMYFKTVLEGDRKQKEFVPKTYEELFPGEL